MFYLIAAKSGIRTDSVVATLLGLAELDKVVEG